MTTQSLEVHVRHQPRVAIIDVAGQVDAFAADDFQQAYAEASEHAPDAILLNLSDVTYINSTGIALLVGIVAKERQAGRRLMVCGASEHYQEIFRVTRLTDFIGLYANEAAALSAAALL